MKSMLMLNPFSCFGWTWAEKLTLMEHFNGRTYQPVPEGNAAVPIMLWLSPRDMLQLSYDALKTSVYQNPMSQTRLMPHLVEIGLNITSGIQFDFTRVKADFTAKIEANGALNKSRLWDYGEQASSSVRQYIKDIWKEPA